MGGLSLILIGMAVMLVAPLHRLTMHRREHPSVAMPLRKAYPPPAETSFADDLIETINRIDKHPA